MSAVRIYVATSVDGFIADSDGGVEFLQRFDPRTYGYAQFMDEVGAVLMGRRTYEFARATGDWPYAGKRAFVLSSHRLSALPAGTSHVSTGLESALGAAREATRGDIWIVGGAVTMTAAIDIGAVDAIDIFKVPVLLGRGLDLLTGLAAPLDLNFHGMQTFADGVVRLRYGLR